MHRIIGSFSVNNQSIISHFLKTQKCYYIRCKYNKQTTIGSQKICYYKRIVTIYDVTISGLKCITEIGKLPGPSICCYYIRIVTISGVTIYGLHCITILYIIVFCCLFSIGGLNKQRIQILYAATLWKILENYITATFF